MPDLLPIDALQPQQQGRLVEIIGPAAWKHRLAEMGCREGSLVQLIQRGTPCILGIGGQRLSFRPDPGVMLLVEPLTAAALLPA